MTTPNPADRFYSRHERRRGLRRWLPGLSLVSRYNTALFTKDLSAGIALTALLAPVGMGQPLSAESPTVRELM